MAESTTEEAAPAAAPVADYTPKKIIYCGVCTLPPEVGTAPTISKPQRPQSVTSNIQKIPREYTNAATQYCEFGATPPKCSEWLEKAHSSLHAQLYSPEAISNALNSLSVDARKRAEKDAAKKATKAATLEARNQEKRATSKIVIKRVERNKRKFVTVISGLENFLEQGPKGLAPPAGTTSSPGEQLKKVAKELGKRFACGSSVTKGAGGVGEEITVQGDVSAEVEEWILDAWEGVPEDNVVVEEVKGKKGAG